MSEREAVCRIVEYDGAYNCMTHRRIWGAVTCPDEPCQSDTISREKVEALAKTWCQRAEISNAAEARIYRVCVGDLRTALDNLKGDER
jgi:hypothetical protein